MVRVNAWWVGGWMEPWVEPCWDSQIQIQIQIQILRLLQNDPTFALPDPPENSPPCFWLGAGAETVDTFRSTPISEALNSETCGART